MWCMWCMSIGICRSGGVHLVVVVHLMHVHRYVVNVVHGDWRLVHVVHVVHSVCAVALWCRQALRSRHTLMAATCAGVSLPAHKQRNLSRACLRVQNYNPFALQRCLVCPPLIAKSTHRQECTWQHGSCIICPLFEASTRLLTFVPLEQQHESSPSVACCT